MTANPNIIAFPKLGWTFNIDPNALVIGTFAIKWYAILIALGAILACLYCFPRIRKNGLDEDKAFDCTFWGIIGGIIGARAYYVLMTLGEINWTFMKIINIREGGLAIYGGIIGAILFAYIAGRIRKIRFIPLLDIAASGFFIGQCIGRWGNFVNQEAYGSNTELPWGMISGPIRTYIFDNTFEIVERTGVYVNSNIPVHPTFLYESLWCLAGFLILHFFYNRRKFDGECILFYVLWYGTGRAMIEGLRLDSLMVGPVRISQVLAIVSAAAALILIIVFRVKAIKNGVHLYKDSDVAATENAAVAARDIEAKERKAAKKAAKVSVLSGEQRIIDDDESEGENTSENTSENASEDDSANDKNNGEE
jgi:phosphatidylglycerol:prolipoprotein diacylglycerol transferase